MIDFGSAEDRELEELRDRFEPDPDPELDALLERTDDVIARAYDGSAALDATTIATLRKKQAQARWHHWRAGFVKGYLAVAREVIDTGAHQVSAIVGSFAARLGRLTGHARSFADARQRLEAQHQSRARDDTPREDPADVLERLMYGGLQSRRRGDRDGDRAPLTAGVLADQADRFLSSWRY